MVTRGLRGKSLPRVYGWASGHNLGGTAWSLVDYRRGHSVTFIQGTLKGIHYGDLGVLGGQSLPKVGFKWASGHSLGGTTWLLVGHEDDCRN